jgi:hypothetical protein
MDTLIAAPPADPASATLFVALELSRSTWLVALHSPLSAKVSQHRMEGGDVEGLLALIARKREQAQARLGRPGLSHLTFCGLGEDGDQVGVIPSGALELSLNRRF